jgi:hypothetical protein
VRGDGRESRRVTVWGEKPADVAEGPRSEDARTLMSDASGASLSHRMAGCFVKKVHMWARRREERLR